MRVEGAMVVVVVACLGLLLVVVIVVVIMTGLGMVIVAVVMPGLFGMLVVAVIMTVLVVERDRVDPFGRHHPDTAEIRSVDQTGQPALELQPVDDKDLRFADGPRVGGGRLVDMRVAIRADERRDGDVLAADALHHVAEDREGGNHRGRLVGLCGGRSGERHGEEGGGGHQKRSAGGHGNSQHFVHAIGLPSAVRLRDGGAGRPAWRDRPTGPKTSDSAQARPATPPSACRAPPAAIQIGAGPGSGRRFRHRLSHFARRRSNVITFYIASYKHRWIDGHDAIHRMTFNTSSAISSVRRTNWA